MLIFSCGGSSYIVISYFKTKFEQTYHPVFTVQMKNCEPLVFGPALAIDRVPTNNKFAFEIHVHVYPMFSLI